MDRLFPLLAGFDRPAARGNPQFQVRGEVRGAGSTAHRVRPLQGSAQMADGDAYPRPADPLSRSMNPMLKEESFHLGTGNNGLLRIVKAGKMPPEVIQRFFYKWIPTAFDLFGTDNSSSAHWAYVWGLKGRYDEREHQTEPDKAKLNEFSRDLYRQEITKLVERLNMFIPDRDRWLRMPDTKFNRKIGVHAHQRYTVDGQPIDDPEKYAAYLKTVLPQPEHYQTVHDIEKEPSWIEAKKADSLLK